MIGAEVMNYTANNVSDWQVFYATENEVFIISKNVLETDTAVGGTDETSNKYTNGSGDIEDGSYGQIWNDAWMTACKNTPEGKSTLENAKTTAYLCDKTQWTRYATSGVANYAVGGPTLQLTANSVKIKFSIDIHEKIVATGEGYNTIKDILTEPYRAKNYNSNNYKTWWIASPDNTYINKSSYRTWWI